MAGALDLFRGDKMRPIGGGPVRRRDSYGPTSGRWFNGITGQGTIHNRTSATTFLPAHPLDRFTLDALIRYQGIARRIVTREPDDAIREGIGFEGLDESIESATQRELQRLGALTKIAQCRKWARAYGGGAIVPLVADGKDLAEPLDPAAVRRVSSLLVLDRHEVSVEGIETNPDSPRFGSPTFYNVTPATGTTIRVHGSRVIRMVGLELPRREQLQEDFWGGSVLDLIWAQLRNYSTGHEFGTEAITLMSQGVFKVDGLSDALENSAIDSIVDRFEAVRLGMGLLGDIAIDSDEEYQIVSRSLSGLRDALDALVSDLVAVSEMPRSILLGETPGGLNSGENAGEIRSWYDHVASKQPTIYTPPLLRILDLVWRSAEGPTNGALPAEGWSVEWPALWQESEAERDARRLQNAQRRAADVASGVISADEARRDPDIAEIYNVDPNAPAPEAPSLGLAPDDDPSVAPEDETETATIVSADPRLMPEGEQLISARMAAERLGVGPATIHAMAARDEIKAWRVGRRWRYAWSQIQNAVNARTVA